MSQAEVRAYMASSRVNVDDDLRENVLPSRTNIIISTSIGLIIGGFALFLTIASVTLKGFILDPDQYSWMQALIIPPIFACAFHLRKLTRWLAIRRIVRRHIVIAEYQVPCPPALAGAMVDGDFGVPEVAGTVIDLVNRGYLRLGGPANAKLLTRGNLPQTELFEYERQLIQHLLPPDRPEIQFPVPLDELEFQKSNIKEAVLDEALKQGLLRSKGGINFWVTLRYLALLCGYGFGVIIVIALLTVIVHPEVFTAGMVVAPAAMLKQMYQYLAVELGILLMLPIEGYIRTVIWSRGDNLRVKAAGLYLFIQTVFSKRRVFAGSDRKQYLPYAVAFGLISRADADAIMAADISS